MTHKIKLVHGFENLPNPDVDGNIITSVVFVGTLNIYSFFQIQSGKLIDLAHSFRVDMADSVKYQQVIKLLKTKR